MRFNKGKAKELSWSRKVTYAIDVSCESKEKALWDNKRSHCNLFNAALQERIDAYEKCGQKISYGQQAKSLTEIRSFDAEYAAINAQSEQRTLRRVQEAFEGFWRRLKISPVGAGFPRFKGLKRFAGWGYAAYGDGYKLIEEERERKPGRAGRRTQENLLYVRLSGIGKFRLRGRARFPTETPTSAEVFNKGDKWFLSVTYKFGSLSPLQREAKEDAREHNIRAYDWGVETFLTIANSAVDEGDFAEIAHPQLVETSPAGELALALASTSGAPIAAADDDGTTFSEVANPRILRNELGRLASMQQRLEKLAKTEENRHRRHKLKNHIANLHGHIANKRKDFAHKEAAKLVVSCLALGTEKLDVKAMVEQEKREGQTSAQKSGRNREILSAAPAMFNSFVKYKAEEAGTLLVELDTKAIKPSQTCSRCGHKRKKLLSERTHACEKCGLVMGRDRNSAKVMLIHTEEAASQAIAALMLLCGSRDRAVGEGEISPIETPLIA